jgi:hypothetical protein
VRAQRSAALRAAVACLDRVAHELAGQVAARAGLVAPAGSVSADAVAGSATT